MTVAFQEVAGSPRERFDESGVVATRILLCAWEDRTSLVRSLMGSRSPLAPALPSAYPGFPLCYVESVVVEPWSADLAPDSGEASLDAVNSYSANPAAKLTVTYRTKPYSSRKPRTNLPDVPEGTFLSYQMRFSAQYIALPARQLRWSDAASISVPEDRPGSLVVPVAIHRLTWHKVSRPPWDAIRAATGRVNDSFFLGAAGETLLFEGMDADAEFEVDPDEPVTWRLTMTFRERAVKQGSSAFGWNHAYRESPAGWQRLKTSDGNALYSSADFAALFQFAV
ncbi:MAG TPA: hypothetical protein VGE52_07345 [Pirellulales bacterium]